MALVRDIVGSTGFHVLNMVVGQREAKLVSQLHRFTMDVVHVRKLWLPGDRRIYDIQSG